VDDGTQKQKFHLNRSYYGLYIPPMMWREIDNFSSGAVCLALVSIFYNADDYYRDYQQFLAAIRGTQVCNLEGFPVRTERAIRNHIFSALCGYVQLSLTKAKGEIANCYEISRKLFLEVIAKFIRENSEKFVLVNSHS